jgi:ribosomal protein L11 methyltransferase
MFTRFPESFQIQRNFLRKTSSAAGMKGRPPSFSFLNSDDEEVESFIEKKGYPLISRNILDYKAWQAGEELKPFKVGDLIISPPWKNGKVEEGEVLVHLDPCVVFGTGYHPTT